MFHQNLKNRCAKLGLKGGDIAALISVSPPKISNFFKGRAGLASHKEKALLQVLDDLENLRHYFPVPIGTHDIKELALTLERLREGRYETFKDVMEKTSWKKICEGRYERIQEEKQDTEWTATPEEEESLKRKFPKMFVAKEDEQEGQEE